MVLIKYTPSIVIQFILHPQNIQQNNVIKNINHITTWNTIKLTAND